MIICPFCNEPSIETVELYRDIPVKIIECKKCEHVWLPLEEEKRLNEKLKELK